MQNDQPLSSEEINSANRATSLYQKLKSILFDYDKANGSRVIPMRVLCGLFAEVYPPTDQKLQLWIYNFSVFGRAAVELDSKAGRPLYQLVGKNHIWPNSVRSLMEAEPAILSTQCAFGRPLEGEINCSVSNKKLLDIAKASSAARHGANPVPSSSQQKGKGRQSRSPRKSRSPRRHSQQSSPELRSRHSPERHCQASQDLCRHFSRSPLDVNLAQLTKYNPKGIQFEKAFQTFVSSARKSSKKFAFQSAEEEPQDKIIDTIAREIKQIKVKYKDDIKRETELFEASPAKPDQWPYSQIKDLLEYKFVDLEKVYADIYGKPGAIKMIKINESKDLEFDEKIKGAPILDKSNWHHLVSLLSATYQAAFPPAKKNIKSYFEYILELASDPSTGIHWIDVRDFDSVLRLQFSRHSWIAFGDWTNPKLKYLENKILFSKISRINEGAEIIKTQTHQPKASSLKTQLSSWSNPKQKPTTPKPKKSRLNFSYEINDTSLWKMDEDGDCKQQHQVCNKVGCNADH
ncbi:uncharacterized protein MELLADRAFT_112556 [Melampsora larici-populina 98AG31]|uniref:Uncharacterized protein n=1 Tax=Melampsora larici-populina (strain 98AG31 / pathotype 3-4-7) TaxID=747676 RepID=F4S6V6_MELLP|nr:uncharacterized protein MELLADRAFT_112556 [Melampsora larici-populina 98AG31]EGF99642.1 hypothetical protein MELLADRAFT_112556 [Melampsora larici-populina 98AG31]